MQTLQNIPDNYRILCKYLYETFNQHFYAQNASFGWPERFTALEGVAPRILASATDSSDLLDKLAQQVKHYTNFGATPTIRELLAQTPQDQSAAALRNFTYENLMAKRGVLKAAGVCQPEFIQEDYPTWLMAVVGFPFPNTFDLTIFPEATVRPPKTIRKGIVLTQTFFALSTRDWKGTRYSPDNKEHSLSFFVLSDQSNPVFVEKATGEVPNFTLYTWQLHTLLGAYVTQVSEPFTHHFTIPTQAITGLYPRGPNNEEQLRHLRETVEALNQLGVQGKVWDKTHYLDKVWHLQLTDTHLIVKAGEWSRYAKAEPEEFDPEWLKVMGQSNKIDPYIALCDPKPNA